MNNNVKFIMNNKLKGHEMENMVFGYE